ncbi:hypothetical protein WDU94_000072 [Cyamophila willieti]
MPLSVKMTPSKYAQSPTPTPRCPTPSLQPHYADTRSLQRRSMPPQHSQYAPGNTYSLPRQPSSHHPALNTHPAGYYTHQQRASSKQGPGAGDSAAAPGSQLQPDFYFMPSQRKYSGEVVRVYVDYNNKK